MKQKTKTPTRQRTALRRILALVLVMVFASALELYHFFPMQAIRKLADAEEVEHPKVIHWFYDGTLPATRFAVYSLVDGDHSLMLGVTGWGLLMGWYGRTYTSIETWEEADLHAGLHAHHQDGKEVAYFYGKLENDAICSLTAELHPRPEEDEDAIYFFEIAEDEIFEKNGARYFVSRLDMDDELPEWLFDVYVTGLDADGNAVQTVKAKAQSWGS